MKNNTQDNRPGLDLQPKRLVSAILLLLTIFLGLLSRSRLNPFPEFLGKYPGDALWAIMVYWIVAFIAPARPVLFRGAIALAISILDELSQAFHTVWLDGIRSTTVGHLVLGASFSLKDIAAYAAGIGLIAIIDIIVRLRIKPIHEGDANDHRNDNEERSSNRKSIQPL
jgi:hypothetical protein